MAIEKSLSQAPLGLGALPMMEEGPELEIEIEDPESVEIGIDGMPILRKKSRAMKILMPT